MTPEQLIEQARLMIRWAESVKAGKAIQIQVRSPFGDDTWENTRDPQWQFGEWEYREKPKPRECWFNITRPSCFDDLTREKAERDQREFGGKIVHMREITEE